MKLLEAKKKRLQTKEDDHGEKSDIKGKKIRGTEKAESVESEPPTEKAVPEYCLCFAETTLELTSQKSTGKSRKHHLASF